MVSHARGPWFESRCVHQPFLSCTQRFFWFSNTAIRCALDHHGPIGGPIDWVDSRRQSRLRPAPKRENREAHNPEARARSAQLSIYTFIYTCGRGFAQCERVFCL